MIPFWAWSWGLTAIGIVCLWAAGSNKRWGWLGGLLLQVLWVCYAVATEQYGFIASAILYGGVNLRNYLAWKKR